MQVNKEARKKLEDNVVAAIEQTLSQESKAIAGKMKKIVKASGKKIAKKFFKTVKSIAEKAAKQKTDVKVKRRPSRPSKATANTLTISKPVAARKRKK